MVLFYHPECDCNLTTLEQTAREKLLEWPPVFVARVNCAGAGATCRRAIRETAAYPASSNEVRLDGDVCLESTPQGLLGSFLGGQDLAVLLWWSMLSF